MTFKSLYQSLPFSIQTIEKHRRILSALSPKLLRASETRLNGISNSFFVGEESVLEKHNLSLPSRELFFFDQSDNLYEVAERIKIKPSENPIVSVIIPVYGKIKYTLNCLASIEKFAPETPFEVLIVDDFSEDESSKILTNVKGVHVIRNSKNMGFIASCNIGAKEAAGEYLHFLNNDTQVTQGWTDELVHTFHNLPGTGLAGSKLVYPNGKLQEAGGIIWKDGSAWNFGNSDNPLLCEYNYARETDYCSGASIMIPKKLFEDLEGFDKHFSPAYCEDSDIALKIREKGFRVIYQPASEIIHYEGISSGKDLSAGAKSYQVINTEKLYRRWQTRLEKHQSNGINANNAKDRRAKYRVLVLDHCTPTPDQDAGSITVFNLLLLLREMDFQVSFIPEDNFVYLPRYTKNLQKVGIEILYSPFTNTVEEHLQEHGERYDLVFVFRPVVMERNIKLIQRYSPQAKILYHTLDLHYLRMMREAELQSNPAKLKQAEAMKKMELSAIRTADGSIVHNPTEFEMVKKEIPEANLYIFPLIISLINKNSSVKEFDKRKDILFVGSYQHTPNTDAVKFFVQDIMPLLRLRLPGVKFIAAGSNPPDEIKNLASEDVIIPGFVEDLIPLLENSKISVAPLRYGAGVKGKVGTAMGAGIPVVATSIAAEGMFLTDKENILVADSPEDFAAAIASLYKNKNLWNKISQNGLEFAESAWGAKTGWENLSRILTDIGIEISEPPYPLSLYCESKTTI